MNAKRLGEQDECQIDKKVGEQDECQIDKKPLLPQQAGVRSRTPSSRQRQFRRKVERMGALFSFSNAVLLGAFCLGASSMLLYRASGVEAPALMDPPNATAPRGEGTQSERLDVEPGEDQAETEAVHDAHSAEQHLPQASEAQAAPTSPELVELWVCEQDESIGLSYEGSCPLDGTPLVKRSLSTALIDDLENERCPVMGGQSNPEIFALYKGSKVRFCCPGCDGAFFEDPETMIQKAGGQR